MDIYIFFSYKSHSYCKRKKKKQKITSVGEHVEKLEPLCGVDGKVKWYSHRVKQHVSSKKLNIPYDPTISRLCIYLKELQARFKSYWLTVVLFTTETWRQPAKCGIYTHNQILFGL